MRNQLWERRLRAAICVVALQVSSIPVAAAQDEAARHTAELEQLRARIQGLRQTLDRDLGRRDAERAALRDIEQAVASQVAVLRGIEQRLAAGRATLARLGDERDARVVELQRERDALAGQLRAAHALGRQERLKLLLNQQDPAAVGRTLVYYDYLNRSRIERLARVASLVDEVAALESRTLAETTSLEGAHAEQQLALAAFAATRDRRRTAIAAIERELGAGGRRLQQLEADEQALVRLLESLADLLADVPAGPGDGRAFADRRGELVWPARGGTMLRSPRTNGLLIGVAAGAEVRAVAYGRVAWAGWMPHYGNLLVIEHGDDYFSLYAHNQALLREVGEWVQAGQVIARAGDSGGQPQPALYFELRKGRTPLNPRQWLAAAIPR